MSRTERKSKSAQRRHGENGAWRDVLTLAEVAGYLRVSEEEVLHMVREQALPGRPVGSDWRFLKGAVQAWLAEPSSMDKSKGIWAAAGSWKDDPYLDLLLQNIYRHRIVP